MKKLILLLSAILVFLVGCNSQQVIVDEEQPILLVKKIERIQRKTVKKPILYVASLYDITLESSTESSIIEKEENIVVEYEPEAIEEEESYYEPEEIIYEEPEEEVIVKEESAAEPVEESAEPQVEVVDEAAATDTQYWAAQYVWDYFHSLGYNDYIVAGLLGNMMVECGGQTLDLCVEAYGAGYYGICQWSEYYPDVWGTDLEYQCQYLAATIQYEMDVYGCGYDYFCTIADEQTAALEFAMGYERCWSGTYELRMWCATEALNYFK